jgi:hypothetical protein
MNQINIPLEGMWRDGSPLSQPPNTTRKVKNGVYYKKTNAIKNEDGFEKENLILPGEILCGLIAGHTHRFLFIKDPATDRIYKVDRNNSRQLIAQGDFNFDGAKIITGITTANSLNQTLIIFVQDDEPIRVINVDADNTNKQISDFDIFPSCSIPNNDFIELEQGGNLNSGAYYCFVQYGNTDNSTTRWINIGRPIFIVSSLLADFAHYKGNYPSTATTKQIQVNLTNVDINFDFINFAFVRKIDNVIDAVFAGKQNISASGNLTFIYSGQTQGSISVEELTTNDSGYYGAKSVAIANEQLLAGNVKKQVETGFFEEALKIKIKGLSWLVDAKSPGGSSKQFIFNTNNRTFCHGEVYAMFARPVMKDGSKGKAYHIPGNVAGVSQISANKGSFFDDRALVGLNLADQGTGSTSNPFTQYQPVSNFDTLYDDATLASTIKVFQTRDTTKNWTTLDPTFKSFDLGFWENENELYDANYGPALFGQKVRHFRFPTVKRSRLEWGNDANFGSNNFDMLGIEVDFSLMDKSNISPNVVGIEIYFAKRDENSITQLGQSVLLFQGKELGGSSEGCIGGLFEGQQFAGSGNFNGRITQIGNNSSAYGNNEAVIRHHSFDVLKNIPNVAASFIRNEVALVKTVGYSKDNIRLVSGGDFTVGANSRNVDSNNELKKLVNYQFLPPNSQNPIRNNKFGEECIVGTINNVDTGFFQTVGINKPAPASSLANNPSGTCTMFTYLTTLNVYRTNVYQDFSSILNFISTGRVYDIGETGLAIHLFGGDSFATEHSFTTYGRNSTDALDVDAGEGIKANYRCIVNSASNTGFRATGAGPYELIPFIDDASYTTFLPLGDYDRQIDPNQAPYDRAYSSVADLQSVIPYNFIDNNHYPYRILRFSQNTEAMLEGDIKQFRPLDFYEIDRSKGEIVELISEGDKLFIQTQYTLLKTIGKETFTSDQGTTSITGNNDIFRTSPFELIHDKYGRMGSQHKMSCLLTPYGLFSVDEQQKKIHLVGEKPGILSDEGLRLTFQNILPIQHRIVNDTTIPTDNPLYRFGVGFTTAYDLDYNRLILSKKDFRLKAGILSVAQNVDPLTLIPGQYFLLNGIIYKVLTPAERINGKYDSSLFREANGGNSVAGAIEFNNTDEYEDVSFTYSYNFDKYKWISEHDYLPNLLYNDRFKLWSIKDDSYEHNRTTFRLTGTPIAKGSFYSGISDFKISVVFNLHPKIIKWFFALRWLTEAKTVSSEQLLREETFSSIFSYTSFQATLLIALTPPDGNFFTNTIRRIKNIWNFNKLRDAVVNQQLPFVENEDEPILSNLLQRPLAFNDKLVDQYLVVNLTYQNKLLGSEAIDLYIYNIEADFNLPVKR